MRSAWDGRKDARPCGKRFDSHREAKDEVVDRVRFSNHPLLHYTQRYFSTTKFETS